MEHLRMTTDENGICTLWFDSAGKSVNTLGAATLSELAAAIDQIEKSKPAALIIASAKGHNFIAGADLFEIRGMDSSGIESFLRQGQEVFKKLESLPMPTLAAINGDCLGGGLELALACTYRVAADDPSIKIGLPEVKLGILPGFGGTVRLTRTIGLTRALPLLLAGKTLAPRKAKKAGIIEETARPEARLDAAKRIVRSHNAAAHPAMRERLMASVKPVRQRILAEAKAETMRRSFGHYPAALMIIDVVGAGIVGGPQAGYDAERKGLLELIQTDACRNLMRIFFLRQGAKHAATTGIVAKPKTVEYATVVGGGTMGAGIVHALISSGIKVRLVEVNDVAAAAGLRKIRAMLDQDVRDGRLDALTAKHTMNRVSPTIDWDGLGLSDIAIEAVLERMDLKRDVFKKLDGLLPAGAVIATNTSSLSVADMAAATGQRGRVIGLHFFNPVPKMPLVEIVRTDQSDDESLATAIALAGRLGKTPVVVKDSPGFLVNRVLIPYLAEAALLAKQGAEIVVIDQAMKQFGWPMGPFELLDEIGLDIGGEVLRSLAAKQPEYASIPEWMSKITAMGALGKKNGQGFYMHPAKSKRDAALRPNSALDGIYERPTAADLPTEPERIQWRLMLPMLNETARVLEDHITDSTDAIDLATVMGLGFPPFRGGLAHFADAIGAAEILRRLEESAQKWGARFMPAALWRKLVDEHSSLADYSKHLIETKAAESQSSRSAAAMRPSLVETQRS